LPDYAALVRIASLRVSAVARFFHAAHGSAPCSTCARSTRARIIKITAYFAAHGEGHPASAQAWFTLGLKTCERRLTSKGVSASLVAGLITTAELSACEASACGICKMKVPVISLVCCFAVVGFAGLARAQAPVAIVEEIDSKSAGIEFMDYLRTGQMIKLGEKDRLVIGYFHSCWREVITGGTVLVGKEDSEVTSGRVERQKVRCDAEKKGAISKETTGSGAMVFRKVPDPVQRHHTVYALSPMFVDSGGGNLVIERLDKTEAIVTMPVPAAKAPRGAFVDLARSNVALSAGGIYRAKVGPSEITFKVDPSAERGSLPIVSRLLRLPSPR